MTSKTFSQELEEVKAQEQIEIQKILNDPAVSEDIKKIIRVENPNPSYHRPMFSIEQMLEVEDPQLRDKNMFSPEQEFDTKEKAGGIEEILQSLTNRERPVIEKIFFEGKSQKEIVIETKIPQQTVSWIINHALAKMKDNPLSKELWSSEFDRTYPAGSHKSQGAE